MTPYELFLYVDHLTTANGKKICRQNSEIYI